MHRGKLRSCLSLTLLGGVMVSGAPSVSPLQATVVVCRVESTMSAHSNVDASFHGFGFSSSAGAASRRPSVDRQVADEDGTPDLSLTHAEATMRHRVAADEVVAVDQAVAWTQTAAQYQDQYLIAVCDAGTDGDIVLRSDSPFTLDVAVTISTIDCEGLGLWLNIFGDDGEVFFADHGTTTERLTLAAGRYTVHWEGWSMCVGLGWDSWASQSLDLRLSSPDASFTLPSAMGQP